MCHNNNDILLKRQGSEFLNRFRSAGRIGGGFEDTWDEIQRDGRVGQVPISQLDSIYDRGAGPQLHQPTLDGNYQILII